MIPGQFGLFLAASLALLLTPGPAVVYIVTRTVDQGRLAGVLSALGVGVGTLAHVAAAAAGLSALLLTSATAFAVVKYLGAGYLIYLGLRKLTSGDASDSVESAPPKASLRKVFIQGIIVNVLNPKTALFFFAFLPQFVDVERGSVAAQTALLGTCFALLGVMTDSLYAFASGAASRWIKARSGFRRAQRFVTGGVYVGLGLATAFAGTRKD